MIITFFAFVSNMSAQTTEQDEVVYSTFVAEGTTTIVLPSTLSGDYEIRFVGDTYYYYGYIEL